MRIRTDIENLDQVERYFGTELRRGLRKCEREMMTRIGMAKKAAINRKYRGEDLNLRKIYLHGYEAWILLKIDGRF